MATDTAKISFKEKVGYGLGDTASNLYFQMFMNFLLFFYTDVFGISATVAGTMLLITRTWDAAVDPIMGMIADRTETKWGKFRPYLVWIAVPIGVIGVLTFTSPNFGMTGKIIYAYATFTLMMMAYTAINNPYSALMGVISSNSLERTSISSYRFVLAFAGAIVVQAATLRLVKFLGGSNQAQGFQLTMVIYACLAVVLFFITFATTKERVQPPKEQKTSLIKDLSDLFHNRPWMILLVLSIFALTYNVVRTGSIIYYFKYYIGNTALSSVFMVLGSVAFVLGVMITKYFSEKIGKRNFYIASMGLASVFTILFYFVPKEQIVLVFATHILISFLLGPTAPLIWAMYADTADYSEWKFGRRATGLIFSAATFAQKLGVTIGGALAGWLLAYFGYKANVEQSLGTQNGIRLMMSFIPAVSSIIATVTVWFYTLDEPMMIQIEAELKNRKVNN